MESNNYAKNVNSSLGQLAVSIVEKQQEVLLIMMKYIGKPFTLTRWVCWVRCDTRPGCIVTLTNISLNFVYKIVFFNNGKRKRWLRRQVYSISEKIYNPIEGNNDTNTTGVKKGVGTKCMLITNYFSTPLDSQNIISMWGNPLTFDITFGAIFCLKIAQHEKKSNSNLSFVFTITTLFTLCLCRHLIKDFWR